MGDTKSPRALKCIIIVHACSMNSRSISQRFMRCAKGSALPRFSQAKFRPRPCPHCGQARLPQRRYANTPADDPYIESIVDNPPILVKSGQKHGPGLIILCEGGFITTQGALLTAYRACTGNCIWTWNMANLQIEMED